MHVALFPRPPVDPAPDPYSCVICITNPDSLQSESLRLVVPVIYAKAVHLVVQKLAFVPATKICFSGQPLLTVLRAAEISPVSVCKCGHTPNVACVVFDQAIVTAQCRRETSHAPQACVISVKNTSYRVPSSHIALCQKVSSLRPLCMLFSCRGTSKTLAARLTTDEGPVSTTHAFLSHNAMLLCEHGIRQTLA